MKADFQLACETLGLDLGFGQDLYLDDLLPWFDLDYKMQDLINDFWGLNCRAKLIAVSKNIQDQYWKGLVSEWDAGNNLSGQFRFNKDLIKNLLDTSLGKASREFQLKYITELELAIFENFFIVLENYWKDFWKNMVPTSHGTFTYLLWAVELGQDQLGAIAIAIPPGIFPKNSKTKNQIDHRSMMSNLDFDIALDLNLGSTRLKISDIRNLEIDDLIVFENSNIDYLVWVKSDLEKMQINLEIPSKDNPRFSDIYYDDLEIDTMVDEQSNNDDLLTDLPVELTAQFKSVHMPLNKILELESGGILPLGLLMDSQLTLVAPGDKPIASGNLVIVGNQFGLRISKLNMKKSANKSNPQAIKPVPKITQQEQELEQELEDVGIDPKELEELEDLY